MVTSRHHFLLSIVLLGCLASLSGSFARVLPKVKRDNATCCAYKVTNRANAYYKYESITDFASMRTMDQFYRSGWAISHGWQAGGANPYTGQTPMADENNVKLVPGVGLQLRVPGGQSPSATTFSVAEITFPDIALGGLFQIEAQISKVPGTVFGFFTIHGDPWDAPLGWKDEQDVEILSSAVMTRTTYNDAGIHLTNFDPSTGAMAETVVPFPSDPTTAFHKYGIEWYPQTCSGAINPSRQTQYRYDDAVMSPAPGRYFSKNPSQLILNLWTNGDARFSAGPPTSDVVVTIKKVTAYYDRPNKVANGACIQQAACTPATACAVTI